MRILIVEDEAKIRASTKRALVEEGFNVVEAEEGETGLHLAATEEFDLIILDVMLPLRDGWSVVKALREKGKQVPVLFLSARDDVPDRVKGLELGGDDYLVKPFAFSELLARVRSCAGRRRGRRISCALMTWSWIWCATRQRAAERLSI